MIYQLFGGPLDGAYKEVPEQEIGKRWIFPISRPITPWTLQECADYGIDPFLQRAEYEVTDLGEMEAQR